LVDPLHTGNATEDFQSSTVQFVNADGHAVGTSQRYDSVGASIGQSGWYWDGLTSIPLVFSEDTDNLAANTTISFLNDDGIVLGAYDLYSGGTLVGARAFLWDYTLPVAQRFHDLGTLVAGEMTAENWSALNGAIEMSRLGHILGTGTLTAAGGGGQMAYMLTPVPEPTGLALLAATGLAMLPRRRRQN
jgi:hypothetical protein